MPAEGAEAVEETAIGQTKPAVSSCNKSSQKEV
jgi:hypothetical protein